MVCALAGRVAVSVAGAAGVVRFGAGISAVGNYVGDVCFGGVGRFST